MEHGTDNAHERAAFQCILAVTGTHSASDLVKSVPFKAPDPLSTDTADADKPIPGPILWVSFAC